MNPPPQPDHRHIRVFIDSTFRDMQAERDHLVKLVFPQLRELCESRGVTWGEVDLRWGVTDEQAAEGKVLPIIFEEIHRCRPYFIGLLGERYGWVPQSPPAELLEREPWLNEYRGRSVTELAIVHAVLRRDNMLGHAFLYFRDPAYLNRLPPGSNRADFEAETSEATEKLARLKQCIRDARDEQVCHLRENYRDPQELGQWILEDFTQLINELFPEHQIPDPLDHEAANHDAFAQSHARVYIGRQEYFDSLDAHVATKGPPLVVLGESGIGKSALLANWFLIRREQHSDDRALIHFIGGTVDSADPTRLLRRIMLELKRRFNLAGEVPAQPERVREEFPGWLAKVAESGPSILVLDGLDKLEDRDGAPDLVWLPQVVPTNVRLILSTLPGRPLDELTKRGWPVLHVKPLEAAERRQLIHDYLAQYCKALSAARLERIAAAPPSANPLYLRALLEELRVVGEHERLDERITHYLQAGAVPKLYERILARWEADFAGGTGLVRDTMTLLWAARGGLSEAELLELLGSKGQSLPRAQWARLYRGARTSLSNQYCRLGFAHNYLREAVCHMYLPSEADQQVPHQRLARFFRAKTEEHGYLERILNVLPFHACEGNEVAIWLDTMTDFGFLQAVVERVDVIEGFDTQGHRTLVHAGYFVIQQEIERWLAEHLDATGSKELVLPLRQVWNTLEKEVVMSTTSIMPVLYHNLKSAEPKEFFDRATKRMVKRERGLIGEWCERERMKYENPSSPWEVTQPPFEAYLGGEPFVFVSYSHKDSGIVYPEIDRLHRSGFRIWYDEGIDPGNEWPKEVANALARCLLFLVFISPRSVESTNVKNEIGFAINRKKPFLAIHVEETALPDELELRICDIQAILKWRMPADRYQRQIAKSLPDSLKHANP